MRLILRLGTIELALIVVLFLGASSVGADTSGPNSSGYNWVDSNAPSPTTSFDWMDVTGGTLFGESDCDDCSSPVTLPFTFDYFGTDYTDVRIGTNGLISFNVADPNGCNDNYNWDDNPIPWSDADCENDGWGANPLIAPWFDDLDPGECGDIYYDTMGAMPNRMFIVQFEDVCHNDCDLCAPGEGITFQTILFEGSNDIKVQFEDAFFGTGDSDIAEENNGGTATVGLNENGGNGLQYSANQMVLTDGLAVLFTTSPVGVPTDTPAAPTDTPGAPAPTNTPGPTGVASPAPTATVAAVALPETGGVDSGSSSTSAWLIVTLVSLALVAGLGYGVLRLRRGQV